MSRRRSVLLAAALVSSALVLPGCLQRRIRITSEPSGALVHLNNTQIGRTPVETTFKYYGTYDVRLSLDGREPVWAERAALPPWYEHVPLDLIVSALPWTVRNTVEWHFDLGPRLEDAQGQDADALLIERAEGLRRRSGGGSTDP